MSDITNKNDISIVLCGQAGQGIQTVEFLLTRILKLAGYNVFATKEYMSRVRGGSNSTEIRISSKAVRAAVNKIDILIPLDKGAIQHVQKRTTPRTAILAEKEIRDIDSEQSGYNFIDVPFTKIATDIGNKIYSNIVATGVITGLLGIDTESVENYIRQHFASKDEKVIQENIRAMKAGYEIGVDIKKSGRIRTDIATDVNIKEQTLLGGTEAISMGAIAGGCNFISAYPMTPSTGVLTFLAKYARVLVLRESKTR